MAAALKKRLGLAHARWRARWLDWRHGLTPSEVQAALVAGLGLPPSQSACALPENLLRNAEAFRINVQTIVEQPDNQDRWWDQRVGLIDGGLAGGPLVVPLGTHCFTAALLKRWGWRREAGPFDWLFSTIPMVAHAIDDDFQRFLDPSEYRPVPMEERVAGPDANRVNHAFYQQTFGVLHMFNHHDVHLPEVHQHFVRAVLRFRNTLESDQPKVFVVFRWYLESFEQELALLREALARRTRNAAVHIIAVTEPQPGQVLPAIRQTSGDPKAGTWVFNPISRWTPLAFPSKLDELCLHEAIQSFRRSLSSIPPTPENRTWCGP